MSQFNRSQDFQPPRANITPINHTGPLPWVQLRNAVFHPSIYRKMIGRSDPKARNGDLVTVYDRDARVFGTGMLNTQSQIGLRMLTFDETPVDESFLLTRLDQAIALRRDILKLDDVSTAWRICHAEGDGMPGLIADKLGDYGVIELFSFPMYKRVQVLAEHIKKSLGLTEVLIRADQRVQDAEGFNYAGPVGARPDRSPDRKSTVITENGIKFQIDLTHGHKTGFFCDQRDNRKLLTQFTHDAEVLDICSYTGGFGVYAAKLGGAKHVVCVDLDEDAIELAKRNANINQIPRQMFETVHADGFPYLRQMIDNKKKFDVVVLDPPKLVPTRDDFEEGRQKYFDLNKLGMVTTKPGRTLITCSCSGLISPDEFFSILRGAARSANRRVQIIEERGPGCDHPVMTDCPESGYLKCCVCRVL